MIAAFLWLAFAGYAQDPPGDYSFDPELFKPHTDTYGYGVTYGASTLGHLQVGVGLWGNYSEDTLLLIAPSGTRFFLGEEPPAKDDRDGVIDKRTITDLQMGLGIGPFFSFSVDLPILMWQTGFEPRAAFDPSVDRDLISAGFGDFRFVPKFEILDLDKSPVGIAFLSEVTMPINAGTSFRGEGDITVMPVAVIEAADQPVRHREYIIRTAVNVGYKIRTKKATYLDLTVGNELVYRAALAVAPTPAFELGAELYGGWSGPLLANKPLEVAPFIAIRPTDYLRIQAGAGLGVVPGVGAPDIRVILGGTLAPSFNPVDLDRDKDGIINKDDACENIPEDPDGWQDEDGCPEHDNDFDGIYDGSDECPNDKEDPDGWQDTDGCPDLDNDGDGIPDVADRCPDQRETVNGYQDDDGCPDIVPVSDRDRDGYRDEADGCPDVAEDFDGYEDDDGCPDEDNDGDGILDVDDDCIDIPEVFNKVDDEDGCPDEGRPVRVRVERTHIVITDKIYFKFDSDVIEVTSYSLLDEIAAVILDHPELIHIQVEGHTDDIGDDAYNLGLSQRRAASVVRYLEGAGVEPGRLVPQGFGESVPIAENTTDEGRSTNRRVEFLILERE